MKVLFISAANNIHTQRWVNALAEKGHDVLLVSCKNHHHKEDEIDKNVEVKYLKFGAPFAYLLCGRELNKIARQFMPDVANVHYASGYGTLARKAKLDNLILSVWGSDVYDYPYQSKNKMKNILKNINYADTIASTSCCMAEQVRKLLNDAHKDIAITPFGVDTKKFVPMEGLKDSNKILIGTVKTLAPKYGITDSIKAFSCLYQHLSHVDKDISDKLYYEIYGRGRQKEEIDELINSLGLQDRIILKGFVNNNELPKIINSFDVFLVTSVLDSESFGVAAVEAMACGVPVVVSDVDGFKEVVVDEETGFIVPRQNVQAAADAMQLLINNEELRAKMGKNGIARVQELYDWNENVKVMEKLYGVKT